MNPDNEFVASGDGDPATAPAPHLGGGGGTQATSRLSAAAGNLAEAAWLAAVVVVAVFFNPQTERIFEEDKIPLLRSLALLAGAALLVWRAEQRRTAWPASHSRWWRLPLLTPVALLTVAYLLATATSVAPAVSWRGAYLRCQGSYTWLAYVTLFVNVAALLRERAQVDRLVTIILLASVAPAVYALVQRFGVDPLPWTEVTERVTGTAGNPVFLSAYLIMVMPLTLVRILQGWGERRAPSIGAVDKHAATLRLALYAIMLVAQLQAILYTQSRGPLLALLVALVYFAILRSRYRRRRWLAPVALAILVATAGLVVALNLPLPALQPLRELPHLDRLALIFHTDYGSSRVRASIWGAVTEVIGANPWRSLLGYGPETQSLVLLPVTPAELLSGAERTIPDRAHNQVFDTLLTVGVLGLLAELWLFLSFFVHTLDWMGLVASARQRRMAYVLPILGACAGVVVAVVVDGTLRFAGVGLPTGMIAALLLFIPTLGGGRPTANMNDSDALLLMALSAGVLAHFVEVQVSFAVAATRLYCWIYLGLAVALVRVAARERGAELPSAAAVRSGGQLVLAPFVALILVLLSSGFAQPEVDLQAHAGSMACVFGTTWLAGALLLSVGASGGSAVQLAAYAAATLGPWLLFATLYLPFAAWPPAGQPELQTLAIRVVTAPALLYGFTFLLVSWGSLLLGARLPSRGLPFSRRPWLPALAVVSLLGVGAVIVQTNLDRSRADALSRLGRAYERSGQWEAARLVHQEAWRWQPGEDRYALNVGRVLVEKARRDPRAEPVVRDTLLSQAVDAMQEAQRLNPLHPDHARNLARVYRYWADVTTDASARAARLERSDHYYAEALQRSPNDGLLKRERGALPRQ